MTKQGPIEFWTGKDVSGNLQKQIDQFNAQHPQGKVTLHELPDAADQQRQQMIQNANKGTAADFIKFLSSDAQAKSNTLATSTAPVNANLYKDKDILKAFPQFPILLKSVETAKPRPKVVNYGDATLAIQDNTYAALQQTTTPQDALSTMQAKLQTLIK